ncbi:MAG: hypothetical protein DRG73_06235 [Deltaproteobacteria bacterium]|nr:MAG: hypothetical protein DRG73_06235 [Deltaproteobacteria bacterium]
MRLVGWCPNLWGSASASVIGHETKKDIPMLLKCSIFKLLPQLIEKLPPFVPVTKVSYFILISEFQICIITLTTIYSLYMFGGRLVLRNLTENRLKSRQ